MDHHRDADSPRGPHTHPLRHSRAAFGLSHSRCQRHRCGSAAQFGQVGDGGVVQKSVFSDRGFSQCLCFNVIVGSNDLCAEQQYTEEQQRNHDLIKSLHDGGMGYRKIADYLNEQGIKTVRGNTWKNTQVVSVLKKYRQ